MSRKYKVWAEIEVHDLETDDYESVTGGDCAEEWADPVPIGEFDTLEEAVDFAESMAMDKEE